MPHCSDCLIAALLLLSGFFGVLKGDHGIVPGMLLSLLGTIMFGLSVYSAKVPSAVYNRLRPWTTVGIVFFLYSALGLYGMQMGNGHTYDAWLDQVDREIFGFDLSEKLQYAISKNFLAVLAFCYAFFIPYIHLSLFLQLESRNGRDQNRFLTSWTLLYITSYLGYVFLPSKGPGAFPEVHQHLELPMSYFVKITMDGVEATGGLFGAFPSLHVGASVFLCWADRRRDTLRCLCYIPIVLGIYLATLALRYHYFFDLLVGSALAFLSHPLGTILWDATHPLQTEEKEDV